MKTPAKTKHKDQSLLTSSEIRNLFATALHHVSVYEALRALPDGSGNGIRSQHPNSSVLLNAIKAATLKPGQLGFVDEIVQRAKACISYLPELEDAHRKKWKREVAEAIRKDADRDPANLSEAVALEHFPRLCINASLTGAAIKGTVPTAADLRAIADQADAAGTIVTDLPDAKAQKTDLYKWLAARRGKELLGLKTGDARLDKALNGLKGVNIFAGNEGCGKTSRVLQAVRGVLKHTPENDAVAVVVSLDMEKHVLLARMVCAAADVTYRTYVKGSENCKKKSKNHPHPHHSVDDWEKIQEAEEELFAKLGKDLVVVGSEAGEVANAKSLCTLVERAKQKSGRKRALLVVDYFQLLGAPGLDTLDADRFRVDELKRVVAQGRKNGDDFGAVIAISEMRKRLAGAKATAQDGSDIMGSTRIKYAAEATLLMSHASDAEIVKLLSTTDKNPSAKDLSGAAAKHRRTLSEAGKSIITVALDKGRDGTQRGTWHETFNFNTYTFGECVAKVNVPGAAKVKLVS